MGTILNDEREKYKKKTFKFEQKHRQILKEIISLSLNRSFSEQVIQRNNMHQKQLMNQETGQATNKT